MFSKSLKTNIYNGAGEDFTARSVRKKGRSLSQTSFLFGNNFIPLPQSFELIDRKRTLALEPSFKWNREDNIGSNHQRKSFNYDSSENNFCSTSSAQSNSNQNLLFVTENNSQVSKIINQHDDSRTDLSTSYRYNPISLENQLCLNVSRDDNSAPSSFTSVKHHILENIPINLISNLSIFLNNKNNYRSFVSSKSNVYQTNEVSSKNHPTNLTISGSEATLQDERYYRQKSRNLNQSFLSQCKTQHQLSQHGNASTYCNESQSKNTQVLILKPASDSLSVTCSSESIILNKSPENRPSSETTFESKSIFDLESNDMRVHYMNDSGTNESEYSLLLSKGYTFAEKQKPKAARKHFNYSRDEQRNSCDTASDIGSSHSVETELRVINFLDYDIDTVEAKESRLRKDTVSGSKVNNPGLKQTRTSKFDQEAFLSCDSELKSSLVWNRQQSSRVVVRKSIESKSGCTGERISSNKTIRDRADKDHSKEEKQKLQDPLQRLSREEYKVLKNGFDLKEDVISVHESCDESSFDGNNQSIRDAVKRINDHLIEREELLDFEGDSISQTCTELSNEISQLFDEEDVESISEESSSHHSDTSFCANDRLSRRNHKPRNYARSKFQTETMIPRWSMKSEHPQKAGMRHQNFSDISSVQSSTPQFKRKSVKKDLKNFTRHKVDSKFKKISKRKNRSTSSRSSLKMRQRYSRCSVTSNSTNFSVYRPGYRSIKGRTRRSSTHVSRKKVKDQKFSTERITNKSKVFQKTGRRGEKLNRIKVSLPCDKKEMCDDANKEDKFFNPTEEVRKINWNSEQKSVSTFNDIQGLNNSDTQALTFRNSKQIVFNFIDRKEIVNLSEVKEFKAPDNQKASLRDSCDKSTYQADSVDDESCLTEENDAVEVCINNRKGENNFKTGMDVYSRKKKEGLEILMSQREITNEYSDLEPEIKDAVINQKKESLLDRKEETCQIVTSAEEFSPFEKCRESVRCQRDEQYFIGSTKIINSQLAADSRFSFHTCEKSDFVTLNENDTEDMTSENDVPNVLNKFVVLSNISICSEVASPCDPFFGKGSTVHDSESYHFICDSTSEYINWAKNCIFNRENKTSLSGPDCLVSNDEENQHHFEYVSEAGDCVKRNKDAHGHGCLEDNFSKGDRCVGVSVCPNYSKTSNESESTSDTQSALSIIPEEKDGSSDKLKSPVSSSKNSTATHVSKHSSHSSDHCVQQQKCSVNVECCDNSCADLVNSKELPQRVKRQKPKHKLKKSHMLSTDSEEEYRKFKEEMNHYSKSAASARITPRIIPSSSTFTPDMSSTHVNCD